MSSVGARVQACSLPTAQRACLAPLRRIAASVPHSHALHDSRHLRHALNHASNRQSSRGRQLGGVVRVQAYRNGGGGADGVADRVIAGLPYLLPLFDGLRYGKFLFLQFPIFASVLAPFDPLIRVYFSVPFAGIVAFFAVYLGIINNTSLSRFVRFNAMQAVLLDIILILPGLIESVLRIQPMGGAALQLYITLYNAIFLFIFVCVAYGVGSALTGKAARLPFVAEAADAQIR